MRNSEISLALSGGPQTIEEEDIELFRWPIITEEDEKAVLEVLRDRSRMSKIDITQKFEREYADWVGVGFGLGYCNGTAALLGAFWACGVGAGDEIICPSMTYWASAAPALTLGATVNFADINPDTLCIDPEDIEHRIGPKTKAVVVVHYSGYPCDMDRIQSIAQKHRLKIIEDVSHAHGSLYKGRPCGSLGDIAAMSMMSGKSFAIGEAGMLLTDNETLYERAIAFSHYERTGGPSRNTNSEKSARGELARFAGIPIGAHKHRMNQLCSALGRVQLRYYPERIAEIQRAMNRFWNLLEDVPGIKAHRPPAGSESTMGGCYNPLGLYRSEELGGLPCAKFCEAVRAEGFKSCFPGANRPLHVHPVFHEADIFRQGKPTALAFGQRDVRQGEGALENSENIEEIAFRIPWFKHDRPAEIERYAAAFRKVAENAHKLI